MSPVIDDEAHTELLARDDSSEPHDAPQATGEQGEQRMQNVTDRAPVSQDRRERGAVQEIRARQNLGIDRLVEHPFPGLPVGSGVGGQRWRVAQSLRAGRVGTPGPSPTVGPFPAARAPLLGAVRLSRRCHESIVFDARRYSCAAHSARHRISPGAAAIRVSGRPAWIGWSVRRGSAGCSGELPFRNGSSSASVTGLAWLGSVTMDRVSSVVDAEPSAHGCMRVQR